MGRFCATHVGDRTLPELLHRHHELELRDLSSKPGLHRELVRVGKELNDRAFRQVREELEKLHEENPDHCGGECFRVSSLDAAAWDLRMKWALETFTSTDRPCECYDKPGQTCLTSGPESIAADGLCGPCAVSLLADNPALTGRCDQCQALAPVAE